MTSRSIHAPKSQRFVRNDTGVSYNVRIDVRNDTPGYQKLLTSTTAIGFSSQQRAIEYGDTEGLVQQRAAERTFNTPAVYRFVVTLSNSPAFR